MMRIEAFHKGYSAPEALRGASLSLARGGPYGLPGPNGAGKGTATRTLLGFEPFGSGTVRVAGHDKEHTRDVKVRHALPSVPMTCPAAG